MSNISVETLKAFLQDEELQNEYRIKDGDINSIAINNNPHEQNMMIVLLREMVSQQSEKNTSRVAATRLNTILNSRLQ